jgi:hypothetical protein
MRSSAVERTWATRALVVRSLRSSRTPRAYDDLTSPHPKGREGLTPDSEKLGERVPWFERDYGDPN